MTGHRLFVALVLPGAVRDGLLAAVGGIAGARWQDDEQLHCTLRFLGDVDGRTAGDVADALLPLRHLPIEAALGEAGTFGRSGRIDTLWIGVTPPDAIRALHHKVDRAVVRAGVPADGRAYHPHVTIARFGKRAAPPAAIASLVAVPRIAFRFEAMRLYESHLGPDGARYEAIETYKLR